MKFKFLAVPVCLLAALALASATFGQAITPQVVAVGSSAIFNAMAVAAVSKDPITSAAAPCGTHVWTQAGGATTVAGIDGRENSIPAEPGKIWVAWDNSTTPTVVCAYITVDSIVGDRLFHSQHSSTVNGGEVNGTLLLNPGAAGGSCQVPFLQDDGANCSASPIVAGNALPAAIQQSLNGQPFNVAFTDIRAEDAVFANGRAQCTPANPPAYTCLGYGPFPIGTPFESSYSITNGSATPAQIIAWQLSGFLDPISEFVVPNTTTTNIGANPITFYVNKSDSTAGGFGKLYPAGTGGNTQSHTLALVFSGVLGLTTDVSGTQGVTGQPMRVLLREAASGTYNTFEWQIPRAKGTDFTQENNLTFTAGDGKTDCSAPANQSNVEPGFPGTWNTSGAGTFTLPPAGNKGCVDPLYIAGPNGSSRTRGIGTGEVVKATNTNDPTVPDAIGYAFWGFSNFAGKSNIEYLTLDGLDPLGPAGGYTGVYPTCSGFANVLPFSCASVTFANVKNGSYRNWNIIRAITYCSPATTPSCTGSALPVDFLSPNFVGTLIQAAQDQAQSTIPDFIPFVFCSNAACSSKTNNLSVFRSHYFVSGANEANGTHGEPEAGGDMLGAIFNVQSDVDFFNNTGSEIFEFLQ
jgi:hypothetical protein